jgi:hypothetical protein
VQSFENGVAEIIVALKQGAAAATFIFVLS